MDIEKIALKLQETTGRSERNEARIVKLEGENAVLHQLATSVAVMAEQMKNMNASVTTLTGEVEELKEKPAKRWETLVAQIIGILVAAVGGYFLAKFGL